MTDQTAIAAGQPDPPKRKFGGPQPGSGRPKGSGTMTLTKDMKELCKQFAPEAIRILIEIAQSKKTPPVARIAAINSVLDRGFGKPTQTIAGDPDNPPVVAIQVIYAKESYVPLPSSKFKTPEVILGELVANDEPDNYGLEDDEDYDTTEP